MNIKSKNKRKKKTDESLLGAFVALLSFFKGGKVINVSSEEMEPPEFARMLKAGGAPVKSLTRSERVGQAS